MKYYWIFKYILYCTYSKKNFVAAYGEGLAFALLLLSPFLASLIFFDYWNYFIASLICGCIVVIDWTITWDDDKVNAKYHYLDLNKWKMEKEFRIVRWGIFIDVAILIFTLIFCSVKAAGWI